MGPKRKRLHGFSNKVPYRQEVSEGVLLLGEALKSFDIEVEEPSDFSGCNHKTVSYVATRRNLGLKIKGRMYHEQVKATAELLECLLREEEDGTYSFNPNHAAIEALTQSGKTGLINLCGFLPLLVYLLTGEVSLLVRFLVDDRSLEEQADREGENFMGLYGNIKFSYKGETHTLGEYVETVLRLAAENMKLPADTPTIGKSFRTSLSKTQEFNKFRDAAKAADIKLLVFCDESHARSDRDGVMDKMLAMFQRNHLEWLEHGVCFFGLSATNFALSDSFESKGYPCLEMRPGKGYTGYPWLRGVKLNGVTIPKVLDFEELLALVPDVGMGAADFADARASLKSDKWKGGDGSISWAEHHDLWIETLAKVIEFLLDNSRVNCKGMLIRAISNNGLTYCLVDDLRRMLPHIQFLVHSPAAMQKKGMTLEDQIDEECGLVRTNKPYVVFVTGRGRMGTVAPADCGRGIEFAKKSEPQTLLQGIPGRITGYNKDVTWVVLSDYNYQLMKNYIDTGRWFIRVNGSIKDVTPYRKHMVCSRSGSSIAYNSTQLRGGLRREIEKTLKRFYEFNEDGEIHRTVNRHVMPKNLYDEVAGSLASAYPPGSIDVFSPEVSDGKIKVAIRLAKDDNDDEINDRDSMGSKRKETVFVINRDGTLRCCRFRLNKPQPSKLRLSVKSMYKSPAEKQTVGQR